MAPSGSTERGAQTRARIVDTAARLVHRRGLSATSVDEVLAASGTGKSQLYHYFGGGKADLVSAVVETQVERTVTAHEALLAGVTDVAGLRAWADAVVAYQDRSGGVGGCPVGSLVCDLAEQDDAARARLAAGLSRWQQVIAAALRRVVDHDGLPRATDVDAAAGVLLTALQGGLLMTQATRQSAHLRSVLDHAIASLH